MSDIQQGLVAYIQTHGEVSALIGTRIYPLFIPQTSALPAIAYQTISDNWDLDHAGKYPLGMARIQLTLQAATYGAVRQLMREVRKAIHGYQGMMGPVEIEEASITSPIDDYAEESNVRVVRMDVILQYKT